VKFDVNSLLIFLSSVIAASYKITYKNYFWTLHQSNGTYLAQDWGRFNGN